jgi:hypothetical protein
MSGWDDSHGDTVTGSNPDWMSRFAAASRRRFKSWQVRRKCGRTEPKIVAETGMGAHLPLHSQTESTGGANRR